MIYAALLFMSLMFAGNVLAQQSVSVLCSKAHRQLSLDMALQTMTLLQNNNGVLPLDKKVKKIAFIGPNVDNEPMMWGNYNGTPRQTITILDGIKSRLKKNQVVTFKGCDLVNDQTLDSYFDQCSMDGSNFELFDAATNTVRAKAGKYEVYYGSSSADKDLKKLDVSIEY